MSNHLCRSRVCLCRLQCASRRASCCVTSFRQFAQLSANFRKFPRISVICRQFPPISATSCDLPRFSTNFCDFPQPLLAHPEKFPANFPTISATSRKFSKCGTHCMGVVTLRSAPGERCVAVALRSGHSNKADCECNVNRICNAWPRSK